MNFMHIAIHKFLIYGITVYIKKQYINLLIVTLRFIRKNFGVVDTLVINLYLGHKLCDAKIISIT